jgi:hypothetical protein
MPPNDMSRYQFLEALVRVAEYCYVNANWFENTDDALKRLLSDIKRSTQNKVDVWQLWREENLWTLEIDDLFRANGQALLRIYRGYFKDK